MNSTISTGITSALEAIAYATGLIQDGHESAILAGGVEDLCVESLLAFQRAGLLFDCSQDPLDYPRPFAEVRPGFALSEGASLIMLEDFEAAHERGARILAEVKGAGSSFDASLTHDCLDRRTRRRAARHDLA